MTHISDLPDEVLLQVVSCFHGSYRNTDLANFALVARRFRYVAQEGLLCEPCFDLGNIHHLMWELGHRPHLMQKVHSLEIWSSNKGRLPDDNAAFRGSVAGRRVLYTPVQYPAVQCPPLVLERREFMHQCIEFVKYYARGLGHREDWQAALYTDVVPALLGVLFVALPNLKELRLAASWLMDFPIFSGLLTSEMETPLPIKWRHSFLEVVLDQLKDKLEVLEFPADLSHMLFAPLLRPVFEFSSFTRLKELSVPMEALYFSRRIPWSRSPGEHTAILPNSLHLLRISNATHTTANWINNICLAKKKGRFPALQRIELFFFKGYEKIEGLADLEYCPHPVHDLRRMSLDAQLELLLYFPSVDMRNRGAPRSVWALRKEGLLQGWEDELWKERMGPFGVPELRFPSWELSVDAGGDVEMD